MDFDAELLKEFLNESWDNLEKLDQEFVELERNPGDPEIITRIFRVIHTMKGCSGLLGFGKLERISHYAEDILSQIREGTRKATEEIVTKLLEAADALKEILAVVEESQENEGDKDYTPFIEELKEIADGKEGRTQSAPPAEAPLGGVAQAVADSPNGAPDGNYENKWQITVRMDASEKMPSIRALVVLERLGQMGEPFDVIPDVREEESLEEGEPLVVFLATDSTPEEIRAAIEGGPVAAVEVEAGEDLIAPPDDTAEAASAPAPTGTPPVSKAPESQVEKPVPAARTETSIRVDVGVIDNLMNLVGELVLSRNRILQFSNSTGDGALAAASHRISLVTSELQENIMKTRMQPIANVFNRFPRMVRDLANEFGKHVDLKIEGKETELDRTLIEAIKDPMVHIIRNSMDHGLESPEERAAAGKPETGNVVIKAFHEGGQVNIQVRDDGAGVNVERVKELAVERGLISQQQADAMADKEAVALVFMAGFSTAQKVTAVSGRGVGMDVVRSNIEKIGGTVDIQSERGKGTTIGVKIPLTLAIIPGLMVSNSGQRFAIPQASLVELLCLEGDELSEKVERVRDVEVYRLRDQLLPLVRLSKVLNLPSKEDEVEYLYIVVLTNGQNRFGLIVDAVHDTEEIVVKPLSKHLKKLEAFAGATILGDGRVALILDVQGVIDSAGVSFDRIEREPEEEEAGIGQAGGDELRDVLLFRVGPDTQFAIPLGLVDRLEEFKCDEIETVSGREVIQYRGDILPLLRPENLLNVSLDYEREESETVSAVVFAFEDKRVGVTVDEILDIQEVNVEFSPASVGDVGVLGTAVVSGATTQFPDIYGLFEMTFPEWFSARTDIRAGAERRVLLVDDSPFYRTMVRSYLEAAGYEVVEAANGAEALETIEQAHYDAVVADIEMPEMDGFELIQNLRNDDRFVDLPVAVITVHGASPYRERAEKVGATAFLVKLDRGELLRTLDEITAERVAE